MSTNRRQNYNPRRENNSLNTKNQDDQFNFDSQQNLKETNDFDNEKEVELNNGNNFEDKKINTEKKDNEIEGIKKGNILEEELEKDFSSEYIDKNEVSNFEKNILEEDEEIIFFQHYDYLINNSNNEENTKEVNINPKIVYKLKKDPSSGKAVIVNDKKDIKKEKQDFSYGKVENEKILKQKTIKEMLEKLDLDIVKYKVEKEVNEILLIEEKDNKNISEIKRGIDSYLRNIDKLIKRKKVLIQVLNKIKSSD
jgi:hypothetical protein